MNNITIINSVPCYEKDGVAYLKLEAVARGLGFTQEKNGVEYVKWERVSAYLHELGFSPEVGKDTFVPENIFYRLAMKAKNETAEAFQAKVADEIIPSIRKTGEYVTPKKQAQRLGEVNAAARIIRQTLKEAGMDPQYVAVAVKSLYAPVGVEIPLLGITTDKQTYDATTIAKRLGVTSTSGKPHAQAVGAIISQLDISDSEKVLVPYQNAISGHSGPTMQYTESVMTKVRLWLKRYGYPSEIACGGKSYKVNYAPGTVIT